MKIIRQRLEIRKLALLYAEHYLLSVTLSAGNELCICDNSVWRHLVKEIETELLSQEDPSLSRLEINRWGPLNIVFNQQEQK